MYNETRGLVNKAVMCKNIKMETSSEEEYKSQLEEQRHMYSWCLQNIGGYSKISADNKAEEFYRYEPESEKYRNLVFHDDAWHWAMLYLKGDQYWLKNPKLEKETKEYSKEYEIYISKHAENT